MVLCGEEEKKTIFSLALSWPGQRATGRAPFNRWAIEEFQWKWLLDSLLKAHNLLATRVQFSGKEENTNEAWRSVGRGPIKAQDLLLLWPSQCTSAEEH